MEKALRRLLVIVGLTLPIVAVMDKVIAMKTVPVGLFLADLVMLTQFFAISLLCLFAAHKVKPFGGSDD